MSRKRRVDEHVVEMRFNNEEFEKKANATLITLDNLKEKLKFNGSEKGLDKLSKSMKEASSNASFSGIIKGLDEVSVKFSALQTISDTVWRSITNSAIAASRKIVSKLSKPINQIIEGGKTRAQNIEQAKFQLSGLGVTWNEIKEDLDYGVQDTAYGLDSAAKAAAQLVASQVKLGDDMKKALRGISGVAAQTNSEYDEIAHIYTTVAGNGRLMGQQLTQLSTKGFNAAATIAKYLNKTEAEVRDMTSKGQISFAIFSEAMDQAFGEHAKEANKTFSGALSNTKAALSRLGADFATTGFEAFRQILVDTIPVLKSLKKQLSPIETILDKRVMELVSIVVNGLKRIDKAISSSGFGNFINTIAAGLSRSLDDVYVSFKRFVDLGGVENILEGLVNIFRGIQQRVNAVRTAFRTVFPKKFIDNTKTISERFKQFTRKLWLTADAQQGLRRVMEALFHPFKVLSGWIEKLTGYSFDFIMAIHNMIDSVLSFIGMPEFHKDNPLYKVFNNEIVKMIGKSIPKAIQTLIDKSSKLFSKLNEIWIKVKELPQFKELITDLKTIGLSVIGLIAEGFKKLESLDLSEKINVDKVVEVIGNGISSIVNFKNKIIDFFDALKNGDIKVQNISNSFKNADKNAGNFMQTVSSFIKQDSIQEKTNEIGQAISGFGLFFKNGFDHLEEFLGKLSAGKIILTSFGVGIDVLLFNLANLAKVTKETVSSIGGAFKSFSSVTKGLGKALNSFATVNTLKAITLSIVGIAAALVALSLVPQDNLQNAAIILAGFAAGMTLLVSVFAKFASKSQEIYIAAEVLGNVMLKIGESVALLAISAALLGALGDEVLYNGLFGVLALVTIVGVAAALLAKYAPQLSKGSSALLLFSLSVGMLAGSALTLAMFSGPKLDNAIKQLFLLILGLGIISVAIGKFGNGLEGAGNAISLAASLYVLAITLDKLTTVNWDAIKENSLLITAALVTFVGLSVLSALIGTKGLAGGGGLLAMAASLYVLAQTLIVLGNIDVATLGKSVLILGILIGVVALLTAISVRTGASNANLNTFASLISIAATMYILAKTLTMLGDMDTEKLNIALKTMTTMFIGLTVLLVTMAIISSQLEKVDWKMLAGIGVIIAGVAISLGVLASVGDPENLMAAGITFMAALFGMATLLAAISMIKFDNKKILSLAVLSLTLATVVGTIGYSLSSLAALPIEQIMVATIGLVACIAALVIGTKALEKINVSAFIKLTIAAAAIFIVSSALLVIASALNVFTAVKWSDLGKAAATLAVLIAACILIGTVALAPMISGSIALAALGLSLMLLVAPVLMVATAFALFANGINVLEQVFERFILFLPVGLAAFVSFLKALSGLAEEIGSLAGDIALNFINGLINGLSNGIVSVVKAALLIPIAIVEAVCKLLGIHSPSTVMMEIGGYIISGLISGLNMKDKLKSLKDTIVGIGTKLIEWLKDTLGIHSPSTEGEAIGSYFLDGIVNGLSDDTKLNKAVTGVGDDLLTGLDGMDITAGVTPVLDMDNFDTSALDNADLTSIMNGSGDYNIATSTAVTSEEMTKYFQDSIRINNNILTEMQGMRRDMNTIGTKVNNLKVYMNTNALVGQIAPAINQKLGTSYNRSARATGATKAAIKKRYG